MLISQPQGEMQFVQALPRKSAIAAANRKRKKFMAQNRQAPARDLVDVWAEDFGMLINGYKLYSLPIGLSLWLVGDNNQQ